MKPLLIRILPVLALPTLIVVLGCSSSLHASDESESGQSSSSFARNVTLSIDRHELKPTEAIRSLGVGIERLETTGVRNETNLGPHTNAVSSDAQADSSNGGVRPKGLESGNQCSFASQGAGRNIGLRIGVISLRIHSVKSSFSAWIALGAGVIVLLIATPFLITDRINKPR